MALRDGLNFFINGLSLRPSSKLEEKVLRIEEFLDSCVCNFLDKIFCPPKTLSIPKHGIFFTLLFTGQHSLQICQQLVNLFASALPQIQLRFAFKPTQHLSSLFCFKDQILFALCSHIVYEFKCQWCQSLYINETFCHLHMHVLEC